MSGRLMTTACVAVGRRCSLGIWGPVAAAPAPPRRGMIETEPGRGAEGREPGRLVTLPPVPVVTAVRGADARGSEAAVAAAMTAGGGAAASAGAAAAATAAPPTEGGGGRGAEPRGAEAGGACGAEAWATA